MSFKTEFTFPDERILPSRAIVLSRVYSELHDSIGLSQTATISGTLKWAEPRVAHPFLLRILQSDPAVSGILPATSTPIALGLAEHAPFLVTRTGVLLLPPILLGCSGALAATTRWGLEAASLFLAGVLPRFCIKAALASTLRHGAALLAQSREDERQLVLSLLPDWVAAALAAGDGLELNLELMAWQASRVESLNGAADRSSGSLEPVNTGELSLPLERILVAGGDSRLIVDAKTGLNRYGTVPRPRPEAVHFSSSTASSISDYGFTLCESLRRDLLLAVIRDGITVDELRRRVTDTVIAHILGLLSIEPSSADVVLAPSGSDTELLAVMLAVAGGGPLTNVLIAPEETGRAIALAGAGCYFDDLAGSGAAVCKGEKAWQDHPIEVRSVTIRAADGSPRAVAEIEAEIEALIAAELARGRRILLHVLACSKTGLSAPSTRGVMQLLAMAPDSIDVVVDACQMRTPLDQIAEWAGLGWMIQLSGSKFFTGPPFSGSLTIPLTYRDRAQRVGALLAAAPGAGRPEDWNAWWRARLMPPNSRSSASFGFLFRWIPALAEAQLLAALPAHLCREVFDCFRSSLASRLARSKFLTLVAPPDPVADARDQARQGHGPIDLSRHSIVCFTVSVKDRFGQRRTLDMQECQRLFELLNLDVSQRLSALSPAEQIAAAQCAHIGQPVALSLGQDGREVSILRLVIGARFFTIVGYAGSATVEAALASEIADAVRAIDKAELLAERWAQITELTVPQ